MGLDTSYTTVILDKNNTAKTSGYIFTGDKVQVKKGSTKVGEYTALILGDTNGDGKISSLDYVKVKNYIMGKSTTKYTITYNANGGSGTMSKQSVTANTTTNLLRNTFTKEGNTFNGWSTKADGSGTTYKDISKIKLADNITLYAIFESNALPIFSDGTINNLYWKIEKNNNDSQTSLETRNNINRAIEYASNNSIKNIRLETGDYYINVNSKVAVEGGGHYLGIRMRDNINLDLNGSNIYVLSNNLNSYAVVLFKKSIMPQ